MDDAKNRCLEAFVEFAGGAGDKHAAADAALAVFHALHNPGHLAAFGQSVLLEVSMTFLRSAVFAIFAISNLHSFR